MLIRLVYLLMIRVSGWLALLNGPIRTPSDPPVPEQIHELNVQLVWTVPLVAA